MGEDGLSISDKKQVKIEGVFDDADLLSEEEKAAMAEDTAEEEAAQKAAAAAQTDDAAAKKAGEEAADEKKAKEIEEADQAIAAEKAKADQTAAAAEADPDKKAEPGEADGDKGDAPGDTEVTIPQTPPPVMMASMSAEEVEKAKADLEKNEQKFQNGEVDYRQYFDARLEIERKLWQNDVAVQLSAEGVENQWQWEQNSFLSDKKNDWIQNDDVVYSAFAATVNRIMSTEEGSTMPGPELLAQAREEVAARFSPTQAGDQEAADEKKKAADAIKNAKKGQANKDIPATLATIPAAEGEEGEGEFGYIDKLDGEAYERAVESLSEAQLARYENSR